MEADLEERQQLDNTQHTQKGYITLNEVTHSDFTALKNAFKNVDVYPRIKEVC